MIGEIERLGDAEGQVSNYRMPMVLAAFVWVFLWYCAIRIAASC